MAQVLDGRALAEEIRRHLAARVHALGASPPGLLLIRVGEDPASEVYVRGKEKAGREVGIGSHTLILPSQTSEQELLSRLAEANRDPLLDGILVQLPLPPQIRPEVVAESIDPEKDVDGLHPINQGRLALGRPHIVACTPLGVLGLLRRHSIPIAGKRVVVLGRSAIVGRPLSMLLSQKAPWSNATVTLAHSGSTDLAALVREAEILVVAMGRPQAVTGAMVRPGVVVVDVGMHRLDDPDRPGKVRLVGDVDHASMDAVASWLSPVPGGVGPLTVAMLLANTVQAAERRAGVFSPPIWEEIARWAGPLQGGGASSGAAS